MVNVNAYSCILLVYTVLENVIYRHGLINEILFIRLGPIAQVRYNSPFGMLYPKQDIKKV